MSIIKRLMEENLKELSNKVLLAINKSQFWTNLENLMKTFQNDPGRNLDKRYDLVIGYLDIGTRLQTRLPGFKVDGLMMSATMFRYNQLLSQEQKASI